MKINRDILAKMYAVMNYSKKYIWKEKDFVPKLVNWLKNKENLDDIPISSTIETLPLIKGRLRIKCDKHGIVEVEAHKRGDTVVHKEECPECITKKEAV